MSQTLKVCDVVRLKSGGPPLTVTTAGNQEEGAEQFVSCQWFVDGLRSEEIFHSDDVEKE